MLPLSRLEQEVPMVTATMTTGRICLLCLMEGKILLCTIFKIITSYQNCNYYLKEKLCNPWIVMPDGRLEYSMFHHFMPDGRFHYDMNYWYAWWKVRLCYTLLLCLMKGQLIIWSIVMDDGRLGYAMTFFYAWWKFRLCYELLLGLMEGKMV